jgi:transcriptional regulator with XRE-family HTH domain
MNRALKIALVQAGIRQIDLARRTGLGESSISRIIHGYREPTDTKKERIACALGCEVEALWPKREHANVNA